MTEKELRKIGFKVIQRSELKRRWFSLCKVYTGYDLYKWDGELWVKIPVKEEIWPPKQ